MGGCGRGPHGIRVFGSTVMEHYCGTCGHFGTELPEQQLVQIRINPDISDTVVAGCHAPAVADLHLLVTPQGRCDAWTPAA